jgi:hypothetical protein
MCIYMHMSVHIVNEKNGTLEITKK